MSAPPPYSSRPPTIKINMTPADPRSAPPPYSSPPRYAVSNGRATEVQSAQNLPQSTNQLVHTATQPQFPPQLGGQMAYPSMQPQYSQLQFIPHPQPQYMQPPVMQHNYLHPYPYTHQYSYPQVVNSVQQYVPPPPVPMPHPSVYQSDPSGQLAIIVYPNGQQTYFYHPGGYLSIPATFMGVPKNGW